jgi:2-keto-3-deoxy-L-rhamnonate aldolase RhmA
MIPDPLVVEAAGRAGFDWVGIDLQHGAWDLELALRGIQLLDALGIPSLARLAQEDLPLMPRLLDHGASGIIIAMVSSAAAVADALDAARYQPVGRRSYGGQRYGLRPEPADLSAIRPGVFAMIEDRRGLEELEGIASVPGLAGLHVGPVDLGLGLGIGRDRSGSEFAETLTRIRDVGHAHGLPVTMHAVPGVEAATWFDSGWDEVVLPADIDQLRAGLATQIAAARGTSAPEAPNAYGSSA